MLSAHRKLNAAMVRVGFAVPPVGNTAPPIANKFEWSWVRPSASVTDVLGFSPIRIIPIK